MSRTQVIIGKFGPSARQILDAALAISARPQTELVVGSMPEGSTVFGDALWEGRRKKDYERGLSYLHDFAARSTLKNQVFLGGACGVPWRKEIAIPRLEKAGVAFYDPEVSDWDEKDALYKAQGIPGGIMEVEAREKTTSNVLLFPFDPSTRGIASINEVVEFMMAGRQTVVIVAAYVEPGQVIAGQALTVKEAMDINIARGELFGVAKARGVKVFNNIEDAVKECIYLCLMAAKHHIVLDVVG